MKLITSLLSTFSVHLLALSGVFNSTLVGHSAMRTDGRCPNRGSAGVVGPKETVFNVYNTSFYNYDVDLCTALAGCSHCHVFDGGFPTQTALLQFFNTTNRVR